MSSSTIVSLALLSLVASAGPAIIKRQGSQAYSPATRIPDPPTRVPSGGPVRDSQAQPIRPVPSLQGKPARDYLKEHGLYARLQNLIDAAQYQIDQQPQPQKSSASRSGPRENTAAEI